MNQALAGIDIGGTKIAIALANLDGEILAKRRLPTPNENGPFALLEIVSQTLAEMIGENRSTLTAIGVGSPGPLDIDHGLIMSPSNLRDWDRVPIVEVLSKKFGVPVMLDNDANAAALGEFSFGAGRGFKNIFYVTVSTGIGGGVIIDGNIHHGVSTGAGEIGHTIVDPDGVRCNCGSVGCLETVSSGTHLVRLIKERLDSGEQTAIRDLIADGTELSTQTLLEAVRRGDPVAIEIWDKACRYLAISIANAISLIAPEVVIIGGGISSAGDLLIEPLRKMVPQYVSMIPKSQINIVTAELGTESALYGAIELAKRAERSAVAINTR
jgi:glucokinase